MKEATVYDKDTGRITQTIRSSVDISTEQYPSEFNFANGLSDPASQYVEHWVIPSTAPHAHILDKEPSPITATNTTPAADGVDAVAFANIPDGTMVTCLDLNIIRSPIADSTLTVTFDIPGNFIFTFSAVKYLDLEVVVNAH